MDTLTEHWDLKSTHCTQNHIHVLVQFHGKMQKTLQYGNLKPLQRTTLHYCPSMPLNQRATTK